MWFTPRIELLPVSGHVFPLAKMREEDPEDQEVTIAFFFLNVLYVGLGLWGAYRLWRQPGARHALAALLLYVLVRTAFLTTQEAPEPRYVLVCFPALIAFGAVVFAGKEKAKIVLPDKR
jgi:peptidoglycan/LPS O-acetylase OafA/YrhL